MICLVSAWFQTGDFFDWKMSLYFSFETSVANEEALDLLPDLDKEIFFVYYGVGVYGEILGVIEMKKLSFVHDLEELFGYMFKGESMVKSLTMEQYKEMQKKIYRRYFYRPSIVTFSYKSDEE